MLPVLALLGGLLVDQQCAVDECSLGLRNVTKVEIAKIEPVAVVGHWTWGGGFTGHELYVFDDRTYLATEWGCVQPKTIRDKGTWAIVDGALILTRDSDVTWPLRRFGNRRYAALRFGEEVRLFGLDGSLSLLALMVGGNRGKPEATEAAKQLSLAHAKTPPAVSWQRVKADLLKRAWNPSYFAGAREP